MEGIEKYLAEMQKEVEEKQAQEIEQEEPKKEIEEDTQDKNEDEELEQVDFQEEDRGEQEEIEEEIDRDLLKKESAWRRMRKQTKEAKDEAKRVKEELEELKRTIDSLKNNNNSGKQEVEKEIEQDIEPDKDFDREAWLDWKVRQQDKILSKVQESVKTNNEVAYKQALKAGIEKLESEYKKNDAEYDAVLDYVKEKEKAAIKLRYPQAKDSDIERHLEEQKIAFFNEIYNNSGGKRNPAEALKAMAINVYGYTGKKEHSKDNKKIDIEALKRNQKKSLSLIGGSSSKETKDKSVDAVFNMTLAEMMSKGDNFLTQMAIQAENDF